MQKTKFDILVEQILTVTEGRKPKQYPKLVIDFDKLENDINTLSDANPFKPFYRMAIDGLKSFGKGSFTNEEMLNEPKTLPEWEQAIATAYTGKALSPKDKAAFTQRFFSFLKDPDREYFSEYVATPTEDNSAKSMEEHIFNFIEQSDSESATTHEIVEYIGRYGHDSDEVQSVLNKMVEAGYIGKDGDKYVAVTDPSLDEIEASDSDLETGDDVSGDLEKLSSFEQPEADDEEEYSKGSISPEDADELGIDLNDPWGDKEFELDNLNTND